MTSTLNGNLRLFGSTRHVQGDLRAICLPQQLLSRRRIRWLPHPARTGEHYPWISISSRSS
jgi:hypothetical protein